MSDCPHCQGTDVIKRGFFPVKGPTSHQRVQRFKCRQCCRSFSTQTFSTTYGQKKAYINQRLFRLLCSGMSQRGCAFILGVDRETVAHRVQCFGASARQQLASSYAGSPINGDIIFDEMETFEHTKCKPLSIVVAVEKSTRRILVATVASMPAKGLLAKTAKKKYGKRRDDRAAALSGMCETLKNICPKITRILSDQCPRYPIHIKKHFPGTPHERHKGRRGCVVGQGELKRGGFDPLFALNHTCAMFRDHLKRLSRRTWCTTKRADRLQDLVSLYAWFHNEILAGRGREVSI